MDDHFVVSFVKGSNYRRLHTTGVLTSYNKNMCSIDLFDEAKPLLKEIRFDSDGESHATFEEPNLINYIHTTLLVAPENIPQMIISLQNLYESYTNGDSGE